MNSGGGLSKVVAIIGGGVSGAGAAYHLAQALVPGQADIIVFEPREELGRGLAYDTTDAAQEIVRPALAVLAESDWRPHVLPLPYAQELLQHAADLPVDVFTQTLPPEWVSELTLSGTVDEVRAGIRRRHDAGASTVVLIPVGQDPTGMIEALSATLPVRP